MKCVILAAGYATRLYPLTENFPKPLLKVGEKTILDWLIDDIDSAGLVDEYVVVTNHKFVECFREWAAGHKDSDNNEYTASDAGERVVPSRDECAVPSRDECAVPSRDECAVPSRGECAVPSRDECAVPSRDECAVSSRDECAVPSRDECAETGMDGCEVPDADRYGLRITVLDDGTSTNETRLGAVCDIQYAIDQLGLEDDLLVIAGDNVLDFSLTHFIRYAHEKGTSCTMRYWESDEQRLRKSGVSEVGENEVLVSLEEKPAEPKSHWCTPPFYFYTKTDARRIREAIQDGCGTDAPGSLVAWMCKHSVLHSMEMPGSRYDIGSLESYEYVKKTYKGVRHCEGVRHHEKSVNNRYGIV